MKTAINEEFDKRHMSLESFEAKNQLERTLSDFEKRLLSNLKIEQHVVGNEMKESYTTRLPGGHWYNWGGTFSRVPEDWQFPNKVGLRNVWKRWFLCDHGNKICPLRELKSRDVRGAKNGRRNLSSLRAVMNFMIEEAKHQKIYTDNPDEDELDSMFQKISGAVYSFTNNKRCETFS